MDNNSWEICKKIMKIATFISFIKLISAVTSTSIYFRPSNTNNLDWDKVNYSDAVNAIGKSNMTSYDKAGAIAILPTNGTDEFYKGIIAITTSVMCSYDKYLAIWTKASS